MSVITLTAPFTKDKLAGLRAGDQVHISGTLYTARDAAHKRLIQTILDGKKLPVDLRDQIIYYVGPTPAQPGKPIGSAGPTTSYRMDAYAPQLLEETGLGAMIGKGNRGTNVVDAIIKNRCVYFAAIGGAGALLARHITEATIVCYEELGPEAIYRLSVDDFPVIVAIDSQGNNLYTRKQ